MNEDENINKKIDARIDLLVPKYLKSSAFTDRKLTDIPTDALQVTSRKYVTMNGNTAGRPVSSVTGQFYFDTQVGKPIWWNGSTFVDATGTPA